MRRVVAVKLHKLPAGNDQKRHTPAPGKSGAMGQPGGALNGEAYAREKVPYATLEDGVMGNRFVDACLESARQERWISL